MKNTVRFFVAATAMFAAACTNASACSLSIKSPTVVSSGDVVSFVYRDCDSTDISANVTESSKALASATPTTAAPVKIIPADKANGRGTFIAGRPGIVALQATSKTPPTTAQTARRPLADTNASASANVVVVDQAGSATPPTSRVAVWTSYNKDVKVEIKTPAQQVKAGNSALVSLRLQNISYRTLKDIKVCLTLPNSTQVRRLSNVSLTNGLACKTVSLRHGQVTGAAVRLTVDRDVQTRKLAGTVAVQGQDIEALDSPLQVLASPVTLGVVEAPVTG